MAGQATEQSGRRSIRLKGFDYSQAGGYFVTMVTFRREYLFGDVVGGEMRGNALGKIVQECWDEIPAHFPNVEMNAFVVMPNHVHGIISIQPEGGAQYIAPLHGLPPAPPPAPLHTTKSQPPLVKPGSLGSIIRSFKSSVTRRAGGELNSGNIWQRNYYEHILRDQADFERITRYILDNPANWEQDEENPQYQPIHQGRSQPQAGDDEGVPTNEEDVPSIAS